MMVNADRMVTGIEPTVSHLTQITGMLTNREGALGEWLIPTNLNQRLDQTLGSADSAISSTETNLTMVAEGLTATLQNLANLTSNLNAQVEANDRILSQVSEAVVSADTLMQGLKRHWLLRSAFKKPETNRVPFFRRVFPHRKK